MINYSLTKSYFRPTIMFSLLFFSALVAVFLINKNLSLTVFFLIFYFLGICTCLYYSNTSAAEFKNLLFILLSASVVYFLYSLLFYVDYQNRGFFSTFPDQNYFYNVADSTKEFATLLEGLKSITSQRIHSESYAVHILSGTIAYFAEKYLSGNGVFLQSLVVSSFAVFTNIFIYKTLRFYVDKKSAFFYALLFSFFSFNFAYSPWLLRDIHILFFFTLGFYLAHKKFRIRTLLFFVIIQFIVINLRPTSGLAFSFFFFLYVYIKGKEYKYRHIIYVLLTLFILISSTKAIGLIGSSTNKLTDYTGYTESAISVSNGIGASLYNLPEGLKQLAIVSVSQIQPFPFWNGVYKAETLLEQFSMLAFGIAAIFWFYVIFVSVLSFIKNYKSLPKTLLLGLIFFCVFLLGNTFNMNTRRIMAVYPIVYTFFVYSQAHYNTMLTKRKTIKFFAIIYIALAIIYILLKYR